MLSDSAPLYATVKKWVTKFKLGSNNS